ncbi:hypothetical protein [Actinokineospora sp.]|uniref:hypothetical protein n=1 Tax=Actinokineospora sp. TaxID=1872133 RepID=UPI003D6B09FF
MVIDAGHTYRHPTHADEIHDSVKILVNQPPEAIGTQVNHPQEHHEARSAHSVRIISQKHSKGLLLFTPFARIRDRNGSKMKFSQLP